MGENATISYSSKQDAECSFQDESKHVLKSQDNPFGACPLAHWCCAGQDNIGHCVLCRTTNIITGGCMDFPGPVCASEGMKPYPNGCSKTPSGPTPPPHVHDKKICIGVNAGTDCTSAKAPISVYSNKYISISCDNCFAGFTADVFVAFEIQNGFLHQLEGGFRQMAVNAALDLKLQASASWSAGVDKAIFHADDEGTPFLSFKVGPIPFMFWFEANAQMKADISLMATAEANAGVLMKYNMGDNYVAWDPVNHWRHVQTTPNLTFSPTVAGSAHFHGHGDVSLVPSVALHLDKVFTTGLTLTPLLNLDVDGQADIKSGAKLCESVDYSVDLAANAEIHIDMLFDLIKVDKTWNKDLWRKSGTLSKACVPVKEVADPTLVV